MSRAVVRSGLLLAALLVAAPSRAADLSFNGYFSERLQLTMPSEIALISTRDLAIFQSLSEANIQGRFRGMDDKLLIYADLSGFFNFAAGYADSDLEKHRLSFADEHDVATYRPFVVISEAYGTYEFFDHLNVLVGKKRVVWGSGQAWNPGDVINPPRDPTDPNFQRAGTWMAKLDLPFERFTFSALVAPKVLASNAGIPYRFVKWPDYAPQETVRNPTAFPDPRDELLHYAAAARLYVLLWDSDINIWGVYTNSFNDDLENRPRIAFSFSRYFLTDYEFHVEALAQQGSARSYADPDCVLEDAALMQCFLNGTTIIDEKHRTSDQIYARILFGSRYMLKDESIVNIEYLYQGDGYTPQEFQDFMRLQKRVGGLMRGGSAGAAPGSPTGTGGNELPLRFSFDPLRRHYLFLSYMKTQILDDFAVQGTLIASLEDLSTTLSGGVFWTAQEWLQLSLFAFLPMPSPGRVSSHFAWDPLEELSNRMGKEMGKLVPRGAEVDGERYGEYDALPFRGRVVGEMRVFF